MLKATPQIRSDMIEVFDKAVKKSTILPEWGTWVWTWVYAVCFLGDFGRVT